MKNGGFHGDFHGLVGDITHKYDDMMIFYGDSWEFVGDLKWWCSNKTADLTNQYMVIFFFVIGWFDGIIYVE